MSIDQVVKFNNVVEQIREKPYETQDLCLKPISNDVWRLIFFHPDLSFEDVSNSSRACKKFNSIIKSEKFIKLYQSRAPFKLSLDETWMKVYHTWLITPVVIALDCSGSMNGLNRDLALAKVMQILDQHQIALKAHGMFCLVFGENCLTAKCSTPESALNFFSKAEEVNNGGTNFANLMESLSNLNKQIAEKKLPPMKAHIITDCGFNHVVDASHFSLLTGGTLKTSINFEFHRVGGSSQNFVNKFTQDYDNWIQEREKVQEDLWRRDPVKKRLKRKRETPEENEIEVEVNFEDVKQSELESQLKKIKETKVEEAQHNEFDDYAF